MSDKWYSYSIIGYNDQCRFCKHNAYDHMEIKGFPNNTEARWLQCDRLGCMCEGFGSTDNLKYLEMSVDE